MVDQAVSAGGAPLPEQGGFSKEGRTFERWDSNINYFSFPGDGEYHAYRFFGPVRYAAQHWLKSISGKNFPVSCLNYNHKDKNYTLSGCPIEEEFNPKGSEDDRIKKIAPRQLAYGHLIVRDDQLRGDQIPWKPVRVPMGIIVGLERLQGLNVHVVNGQSYKCTVSDPYYGVDVFIAHNPKEPNPNNRYDCQKGNHSPLTEIEKSWLAQLHDWDSIMKLSTAEDIKRALQQNGYYQILNGGGPQAHQAIASTVLPPVPAPGANPLPPVPSPEAVPQPVPQAAQPVQPQPAPVQPQPAPQAAQPVQPQTAPQPMPVQPQMSPPNGAIPQPQPQQAALAQQPMPQGAIQASPSEPAAPPPPTAVASQPVQPQAQAQPASAGGVKFTVPGSQEPVTKEQYQQMILTFGADLPRAQPFTVSDKNDDTNGMQVFACFGSYKGDPHCIRCPLRRFCLQH